jgi:hypothetical protein
MHRVFAVAILLSCFTLTATAQTQSPPGTPPAGAPAAKPAVKKAAPKAKTSAKTSARPAAPPESGPCIVGVIAANGDLFSVQKVGLTVFGNELAEVSVPWGLDDLIFARVRAAAGTIPVRRITYPKGAFDAYYHPQSSLFRNSREELTNLVREITANAGCERYLVVTRFKGQLEGTNQTLEGIGVLNWGTSLFSRTLLFANVSVVVFDGQTYEIRRTPRASLEEIFSRMAANLTKDGKTGELDNSAFPASPPEAASSALLRDRTRALLTERLDKSLPAQFKE